MHDLIPFPGSNSFRMHRSFFVFSLLSILSLCAGPVAVHAQNVLTLEDAVGIALERNFTIRIARNDARAAANDYSLGNAGFLPSVSLSAQQARRAFGRESGNEASPALGSVNTVDLAMNLNTTLFDGFGQFATYQWLESQMDLAELRADRTTETAVADVVISYYDLVRQQQQIEVLEEAVEISQERVDIAQLRNDLGSASELEVRRARVDLNADRATLLRQRVSLTNAKAEFNRLLASDGGLDYVVADTIHVLRNLSMDDLRVSTARSNKTLAVVRESGESALLARREVRSEWFPTLDLTAGYAFNDLSQEIGMIASRPPGLSYGLTATVDLFDGFNRRRRRENADLQVRNAELALADAQIAVETQLENAYQNFQFSLELIDLERENMGLAQLNLEVALERFRLGTITSVELREVQSALTNAESRFITAQYEAARAQTELLQLSGLLVEQIAN
jgi:outer membrane protein TolC